MASLTQAPFHSSRRAFVAYLPQQLIAGLAPARHAATGRGERFDVVPGFYDWPMAAIGFPRRVMTTSSPASTRRSKRLKWDLAADRLTVRLRFYGWVRGDAIDEAQNNSSIVVPACAGIQLNQATGPRHAANAKSSLSLRVIMFHHLIAPVACSIAPGACPQHLDLEEGIALVLLQRGADVMHRRLVARDDVVLQRVDAFLCLAAGSKQAP